jgi:hypothetical protein
MVDFEHNVKVDPKVLDETVKNGVEAALLMMTEKKMMAEQKLISMEVEMAKKDQRIRDLEDLVLKMNSG